MLAVHLLWVAVLAAGYVLLNFLFVAWASRSLRRRWRQFIRLVSKQLTALSDARIWVTVLLQIIAVAFLVAALSSPLSIVWLVLTHVVYIFFVSALTLSLLGAMPLVRSLWADRFVKAGVFVVPLVLLFIGKGYAALWVGEYFGIGASNLPMTHTLATCFFLLAVIGFVLSAAALLFEALLLFAVPNSLLIRSPSGSKSTFSMSMSTKLVRLKTERTRLRSGGRFLGLVLMTGISFLGCYTGFSTVVSLIDNRVAGAALAATAFDFDAAPATQCELTNAERALSGRPNPTIKALFLSSTQEKALLIERTPGLFAPIVKNKLSLEPADQRKLTPIRVAECYRTR